MIIICGIAHSYTSLTAKFIKDNGGEFIEFRQGYSDILKYEGHEDNELMEWAEGKKKFNNKMFNVRDIIAKYPEVCYFLDSIPENVKIVFCLRNPEDVINSHYSKYRRGFFITFNKFTHIWNNAAKARQDVYILMTERLIEKNEGEAKRLLDFVGLNPKNIIFDFDKINNRRRDYKSYRLHNLIWKILYKMKTWKLI